MITKPHNYKYVSLTLISILLMLTIGLSACTPTPEFTNSGSDSRIAELEAEIRQLEAGNERLLAENRQLNSELVAANSALQDIESVFSSPSYAQMVSNLNKIEADANELAAFLGGLPDLPPFPSGLTTAKIDDAINKAVFLRGILENLPPPPPLIAPPEWYELDEMKDEFIRMTEWMEDLEELPEFLNIAGDLDDLRYQEIDHLQNINTAMDDVKRILEEVRDVVGP